MSEEVSAEVPKGMRYTGIGLTTLSVLFLLFSASGKILKPEGIEANIIPLGWRMDQMTWLGIVEVACAVIYAISRTSVFGAVIVTAYLGGAVATHIRIGDQYFFPIVLGLVVWLGIYLREPRLWPISPFRR